MPELPEVETVVRDLRPLLTGRRLGAVQSSGQALRHPWSKEWDLSLAGRRVEVVGRRGKWIVLSLDRSLCLVFHLGMSGQLTVVPAAQPPPDHTHLMIDLLALGQPEAPARKKNSLAGASGRPSPALGPGRQQLRFRDIRRFGSARLFTDPELQRFFTESGLGPEPFDLEAASWKATLGRTERVLKAVLLDQRVLAGVGNIYADESLFEARLHPARIASGLSAAEAERLRKAVGKVLAQAIAYRGSSIRDYVGGSGLRGGYQDEFRAYKRTGLPCRRCRTPIECLRLAGRSTHYCPRCQPDSV